MAVDSREIAGEIEQQFTYADTWRSQYDEKALKYWKLFNGYKKPLAGALKNRSNLHIPKTYELVDALRSRYLKAIFNSSPVIEYIPDPLLYYQEGIDPMQYLQMLISAEDSAKYATYLVDQQLRNTKIYRQFYDFITAFLVFPCGILSVGWRYEEKVKKMHGMKWDKSYGMMVPGVVEQKMVTFDDNEITYTDYFDFWPDPRGTDLDNCRFVFVREYLSKAELEQKLKFLLNLDVGTVWGPGVGTWTWDSLAAAGSTFLDRREDRAAQVGMSAETQQGYWRNIASGYLFEVIHRYSDDEHAMWVNRQECVYSGENIYWHGKKPLIVSSFDPKPGEFYGFTAVEILEHLQAELNTNRNQRIDNVSMVLNRMWKARRDVDINPEELVSRPHGVIWLTDTEGDVKPLDMQDVTSSGYNEEQITKEDMDNAVGAPAIVRGVEPARDSTATETVTKSGGADIKFQAKVMLYEVDLDRLAELLDMNNQQFIDRPRIFKIEDQWKVITPEEIRGHRQYRRKDIGLDAMHNREVRRQQVLELQKVLQDNPYIDQYELLKLVLEAYSVRGTERLLMPQEQIQAMQAQQAAQMAMPGGAPGQGAPTQAVNFNPVEQLMAAAGQRGVGPGG